jgi:NTE family protein
VGQDLQVSATPVNTSIDTIASQPAAVSSAVGKIGLALSGGGVRAAAFHLGVISRLAEEGLLEEVSAISTVSGGSLVVAAIISQSAMRWPSSRQFLKDVFPSLRCRLSTTDLFSFKAVGWGGLLRFNVSLLVDRAGVLSALVESQWGVSGRLSDLPDSPRWLINATCLDTGKNWRFAKREMGDWMFGRNYAPDVPLSVAVAASAAVPYAIGALTLQLPKEGWWETDPATGEQVRKRPPPSRTVRLWDGGAYDNMGLEAVSKPGRGLKGCDFLICSDASGPLRPPGGSPLTALAKGHLSSPRLYDVASDQIRSLRSRMLIADITSGKVNGVLLRMGNSVRGVDVKSDRARPAGFYDAFQSDEQAAFASQYPTDLKALSGPEFDGLARHGFEVADITMTTYAPAGFPRSLKWEARS